MLGLIGIRVDKTEEIGPAWEQALSAQRPVVLEAITDPEVPTLPPHITFEEAKKFTESMVKGDLHLGHMIKQTFKDAIETFLPHKSR
jgi:pyruvate dehydrogenase (quinone)